MDREDLASVCRREWPRLVGSLSLYTGDRHLAEELAQEALARLCRDWSRVQSHDSPTAWVHRVAINLSRSHWRRVAVGRRAQRRLEAQHRSTADTDVATALALRTAVAALPARQRAALVLRYFADLSVAETAAAMRCPEGTVKTLTRAAIAALRSQDLVADTRDQPGDAVLEPRGT
jgi:RNA polymerase sigma-70 factor (ECF subfamily)